MQNRLARARRQACAQCGSPMAFDPARQLLHCASCHSVRIPDKAAKARPWARAAQVAEIPYQPTETSAQGDLIQATAIACPSCGAEHPTDRKTVATLCPFCATPLVGQTEHLHNHLRPQGIVPFALTEGDAYDAMAREASGFGTPRAVSGFISKRGPLLGIYAAFFTFDAQMRGTYMAERRTRNDRVETKTGGANCVVDDALVAASEQAGITQSLGERTQGRGIADSVKPYSQDYLAGFHASLPTLGLAQAHSHANRPFASAFQMAASQDAGYGWRIVDMNFQTSAVTWKLLLLPVWLGRYSAGGKSWWVAVNGSTGDTVIQIPSRNWLPAGTAILALGGVMGYLTYKFSG